MDGSEIVSKFQPHGVIVFVEFSPRNREYIPLPHPGYRPERRALYVRYLYTTSSDLAISSLDKKTILDPVSGFPATICVFSGPVTWGYESSPGGDTTRPIGRWLARETEVPSLKRYRHNADAASIWS